MFGRLGRALPATLAMLAPAALGCTITTYSADPPPPPPSPPAAQGHAAPAKAAKPAPNLRVRPAHVGAAAGAGTADVAPKITSPIAFGNGTGGAFRGLAYVIPENTTAMPNLAQLVPFATLYTDSFQVQPQEFSGGFPGALAQDQWFAIRYDGTFAVAKDDAYQMKLVSDDGAIVYVDGEKVIDNDGQHTIKPATGKKDLKAGPHRLRLDYFQAKKGPVALMLFIVDGGQDKPLVGGH